MIPRSLLLPIVLLAASWPALAGDDLELRWGLEKDRIHRYKVGTRSEVGMDLPQRGPVKTVVDLETRVDLTTGAVKTGKVAAAPVSGLYTGVKFHIEIPTQGSASFDSESELDRADIQDPMKRSLQAMITKKPFFSFQATERGGVSKMNGHNRFVPRAFNPKAAKEPIPMAANLVLSRLLADKAVEETFQDLFIPLPTGTVLPGDTWKGKTEAMIYPLGTYIFDSTYTLKEVKEGKTAVITIVSDVSQDPRSEPGFGITFKDDFVMGNLKDVFKKLKASSSKREGEFEFDLEKRELVKGKVELDMDLGCDIDVFGQTVNVQMKATHARTMERLASE